MSNHNYWENSILKEHALFRHSEAVADYHKGQKTISPGLWKEAGLKIRRRKTYVNENVRMIGLDYEKI